MKRLVVNADDFGRSHGINRGVALAHDQGIVTSASAMVCWPAAEEAAELARARPALGVGLHVDLGEWVQSNGDWRSAYRRPATAGEVEAQLGRFRALFGREPTHLDSHQHVHREEPLRAILTDVGRTLGIPVRDATPGIVYRGDFYGQTPKGEPFPEAISVDALLRLLSALPPGVTELGCHPAAEPELESSYAAERPQELQVLCDPRVRAALEGAQIELCSFERLVNAPS